MEIDGGSVLGLATQLYDLESIPLPIVWIVVRLWQLFSCVRIPATAVPPAAREWFVRGLLLCLDIFRSTADVLQGVRAQDVCEEDKSPDLPRQCGSQSTWATYSS
jgi:hypothetical protein